MRTEPDWTARLGLAGVVVLGLSLLVSACGRPSLREAMAGTYATDSVQADLEEHERAFIGDDLHQRFDTLDRAQAEEEGSVWARLRLHGDGRFGYEGPLTDDGAADAWLGGRWTARSATVELEVEDAQGDGADGLQRTLSCPCTARSVDLPFLHDPKTGRPVRLARR